MGLDITAYGRLTPAPDAPVNEMADAWGDEYWRERYAYWRQAFEMAADGGAVDFH